MGGVAANPQALEQQRIMMDMQGRAAAGAQPDGNGQLQQQNFQQDENANGLQNNNYMVMQNPAMH